MADGNQHIITAVSSENTASVRVVARQLLAEVGNVKKNARVNDPLS